VASTDGALLVTGANGRLGQRLIARLAGARPLRALVRSERAREQLDPLPDGVEVRVVDYGDAGALAAAAQGCTQGVHLVGIIKESARSSYTDAHEGAARALAKAAYAAGLERVVYLSILGAAPNSGNPCFASRGRGERVLLDASTPALVLRVPMVLGEGDPASMSLRRKATRALAAVPRASSREQPVYAGDVVEATVAGLVAATVEDDILDLAGPESLERRALLVRAAAALGRRAPVVVSLPFAWARALAWLLERGFADPPVTPAMLEVLDHDDDVDPMPACERLGITLTSLDETLKRALET